MGETVAHGNSGEGHGRSNGLEYSLGVKLIMTNQRPLLICNAFKAPLPWYDPSPQCRYLETS